MKKILFTLGVIALLSLLMLTPASTALAHAPFGHCVVSPGSGPIGTVFVFSCGGFTRDTWLWSYMVEPGGATFAFSNAKTNEKGEYNDYFPTFYGDSAAALGKYTFVVDELGPNHTSVHHDEVSFVVTGGTEGVSGALVSVSPSVLHKAQQAYAVDTLINVPGVYVSIADDNYAWLSFAGTGFASNEMVTVWLDFPNGDCDTHTFHYDSLVVVGATVIEQKGNDYSWLPGLSTIEVGTFKADKNGSLSLAIGFPSYVCEGQWKVTARGNSSKAGDSAWFTLVGNSFGDTTALLTASPNAVAATLGRVTFTGAGYKPLELVSCWLTSPQGVVVGVPDQIDPFTSGLTESIGGLVYIGPKRIQANGAGAFSYEMVTGGQNYNLRITVPPVVDLSTDVYNDPLWSEGPLGVWKMSCRGDASGALGITEFTIVGGTWSP